MGILILFAYNFLLLLMYLVTLPYIAYKRRTLPHEWQERMGRYTFNFSNNEKCIWIHGASLGEIAAASHLARGLRERYPHRKIIVSAMTVTGRERASEIMPDLNEFVLMPFDFFPLVSNAVERVNPQTLILIETEIWPTLLHLARKKGVHVVLANARLSDGTFRRYRKLRSLSAWLFNQIDLFIPKNERERRKFIQLGVPKEKIKLTGCLKSDNGSQFPASRDSLLIPDEKLVVIAGSVRKGEEEIVIQAFKRIYQNHKTCYLIIAPRHLNRVGEIETILTRAGLQYRKRTEKASYGGEQVLILDTVGELRNVYAVADIAFVGGTLLPYGGHNPLEPAYFGIPVLFGPYVNNIRTDVAELIESRGALMIRNADDFVSAATALFRDSAKRKKMGLNAREFLAKKQGIVDSYIEALEKEKVL